MDALTCIETRRSIRKFENKPVPQSLLLQVIREASFAPSWKNTQTVRYNCIESEELKQKIAENAVYGFVFNNKTITRCPCLVAVSSVMGISGYEPDGTPSTSKEDRWQVFDAGIATQTFCLAAHELGLGTVILGIFEDEKVAEIIGLPQNEVVSALIAVGYPEKAGGPAPARKQPEELARFL